MRRLDKYLATVPSQKLLAQIRKDIAPQIEILRLAQDFIDASVGRPVGTTKGAVTQAVLEKYGPARYIFHNPATQDAGWME